MPDGVLLTCTAVVAIDGTGLSLNGLSNGYVPSIILSGPASAPTIATYITGSSAAPPSVTVFEIFGGYMNAYEGDYVDYSDFSFQATYNLSDGHLLTILVEISASSNGSFSIQLAQATTSDGSLYAATDLINGGNDTDGLTFQFTIGLAN